MIFCSLFFCKEARGGSRAKLKEGQSVVGGGGGAEKF